MATLSKDARYALRLFAKSPGFAAVAALTLAVGIGANTAIFSVANTLLLRPLNYAHPERLMLVSGALKASGSSQGPLSWLRFSMIQERNRSFSGVAAFTSDTFNLTDRGDPEQLRAARVSWNFFDVLGVAPQLGRSFAAAEGQPQGVPVALISHSLWTRRFAAAPSIAGRHIALDGQDFTVLGVLPEDFRFAFLGPNVDLFVPRPFELNLVTSAQIRAGVSFLLAVGRLRDGVGIAAAQAEMDALAADYRRENPSLPDANPRLTIEVGNLRDEMVSGVRPAVLILFGAVSLVLLIACANVASLLLSRALGRRREIAVRTAIGATRGGILRQLLTESLLLAVAGGALGTLLSSLGTRVLASMAQASLPRASEIHTDGRVLGFTAAVSILAGILFGLAPALQAVRTDLNTALRSEGRGSTAGRQHNAARSSMVVAQVALSMVLLIGSGLLLRNFIQLRTQQPGFDARNLLSMNISLPPARYPGAVRMAAFFDELVGQVRALPGVRAAAVSSALPVNPTRVSPLLPEGQPVVPFSQRPFFNIQMVVPGYVETMRLPLLRGREFTPRDDGKAPLVALVNELVARRFWPRENAVGKHLYIGNLTPVEVVGVVGDVRNQSLAADVQPEVYFPFAQRAWPTMNLVLRTAGDPHALTAAVLARLRDLDRDQPVTAIRTMDEVLESAAAQPRFTTSLLGSLSGMALLLAIVGIYSVIAYSVAERTQEMGIRIALGAERADILRLVLRHGMLLAAAGIAVGIITSLALTRLLASLLYRVSVTDAATFISGALLFAVVALAASYIPARRATRVDPMVALRYE